MSFFLKAGANGALPYPFTPKAGANGALAAAPSKPGFETVGRKAVERAQKFLCRTYGAQFSSSTFPSADPPLRAKTKLAGDPAALGSIIPPCGLRPSNGSSDLFAFLSGLGHCPLSHLIRSNKSPRIWQRSRAMSKRSLKI